MVRIPHSKLKKNQRLILVLFAGICLLLTATKINAQGYLEVPVKLDIEKGHLDNGVVIKVKKDGKDAFTQDGKGKIRFKLNYNLVYTLIFIKEGYITKTIEFDTHVPASRMKAGFDPYTIGVKLFPQESDVHKVAYNQAVGRIHYDEVLDEFNYDTDYSKSILSNMGDDKMADNTAKDTAVSNDTPVKNKEQEKISAKEERRNKKKLEEEKEAAKKLALEEKKESRKKLQNNPEEKIKDANMANQPDAGAEPNKKLTGNGSTENKNLLASSGGSEEGSGMLNENGNDVNKPRSVKTGQELNKPGIGHDSGGSPRAVRPESGGSENQNPKMVASASSENPGEQKYIESENITREDIVEERRVITIIKVTKRNVTTEYRRVTYRWGGLYYFQDNKLSISETVFAFYTGVKE